MLRFWIHKATWRGAALCLLGASRLLGGRLKRGDIVVYESTVYPSATEEDCLPALEHESGLQGGKDFFLGYSPERINPGDREHNFTSIKKVVSAAGEGILDIVAEVYGSVVSAGVHKAPTIKVAEAAKVIVRPVIRSGKVLIVIEVVDSCHKCCIGRNLYRQT